MRYILGVLAFCALTTTLIAKSAVAAPTAPAILVKPSFAVLVIGGKAAENERSYTARAIVRTLRSRGFIADEFAGPAGDVAVLGPAICVSTGAGVLLGGTIAVDRMDDREINQWATADIELAAFDCATNRALEPHAAISATYNWTWAVDRAVDVASKSYTRNYMRE